MAAWRDGVCLLGLQKNLICQVCLLGPTPSLGPARMEALFKGTGIPGPLLCRALRFLRSRQCKGLGILVRSHSELLLPPWLVPR